MTQEQQYKLAWYKYLQTKTDIEKESNWFSQELYNLAKREEIRAEYRGRFIAKHIRRGIYNFIFESRQQSFMQHI